MITLLKLVVKSYIAQVRWGTLSEAEEQLVFSASLCQVLGANYITRSKFSDRNIVTLDQ